MPYGKEYGNTMPVGKYRKLVDPELFRSLLDYDPEAGTLTWKVRDLRHFESERIGKGWNTKFAGRRADGCTGPNGYTIVRVFNEPYLAHRVAWAIYYGEEPPEVLDHIDRNRKNFRIANLRKSDPADNLKNLSLQARNVSGLSGIKRLSPKQYGKPWAVAMSGIGKMEFKAHQTFCSALKHRNAICAARGYSPTHGNVTIPKDWKPIGVLAAALVEKVLQK